MRNLFTSQKEIEVIFVGKSKIILKGGDKDLVSFVNNFLSDILSIGKNAKDDFRYTNAIMCEYFYKAARVVLIRFFAKYGINSDRLLLEWLRKRSFVVELCTCIATFISENSEK